MTPVAATSESPATPTAGPTGRGGGPVHVRPRQFRDGAARCGDAVLRRMAFSRESGLARAGLSGPGSGPNPSRHRPATPTSDRVPAQGNAGPRPRRAASPTVENPPRVRRDGNRVCRRCPTPRHPPIASRAPTVPSHRTGPTTGRERRPLSPDLQLSPSTSGLSLSPLPGVIRRGVVPSAPGTRAPEKRGGPRLVPSVVTAQPERGGRPARAVGASTVTAQEAAVHPCAGQPGPYPSTGVGPGSYRSLISSSRTGRAGDGDHRLLQGELGIGAGPLDRRVRLGDRPQSL